MSNFSIGLSGLDAAQKALDVIGNNIANAATEGYHRQRVNLSPNDSMQQGSVSIGGGVNVTGITRMMDTLLEREILQQQSLLEQVSQESGTLLTIENAFGELSTEDGGLNAAIDRFFNSLQDLTVHPSGVIWQSQVVSDAEALASQFRTLGEFLDSLEARVRLEVDSSISNVNTLVTQIADFNDKIEVIEMKGGSANSMKDQRDQCISKLSELIGIQTLNMANGVINVSVGGIPLVVNSIGNQLEAGFDDAGDLGVSIIGAYNYATNIQGGKIGGLLSLKNEFISDIHTNLDSLASTIIEQINQYHVQGVGSSGSFSSLTGWTNASEDLADISNVTSGSIFVRVTNTSTGAITRTEITVNAGTDSLSDIASLINGVANVTSFVNSSNQLTITAGVGYEYDFLPAVLSEPTATTLNGSPPTTITVSGIYTGTSNDTLTFTVSGDGSVGNDASLQLTVTSSAGTIATINVGTGYAVGDKITIGDTGIKIALSTGDLVDGETFEVDVFGDTDTSGLLAAVGINTFFSGNSAENMAVSSDISADPRRVATAIGPEMTDNNNAVRMADVKDSAVTGLGSLTCGEFYRQLVTDLGRDISLKQMRQENVEIMVLNLASRRSEISGVNINDEAAQLLVFEQMFQAMAKYMNTVNESMATLMELL